MNIHPIFVHFPVALFTVYAILELIRFKKILVRREWFYIKLFLVVAGIVAAKIALATGEMAEHLSNDPTFHKIVEIHSLWANITTLIFSIIAIAYLISWINQDLSDFMTRLEQKKIIQKIWTILTNIQLFIMKSWVLVILALSGLFAVTTTGALGASIVYGPTVDPVVTFFYQLFVH